jgi:hypothetical protein
MLNPPYTAGRLKIVKMPLTRWKEGESYH